MSPAVASRRVPSSTYRLQLSAAFTLADAVRVVPYLDALGVGAVYLSPCLKSKPGSPHGYDIVDHNQVDPELGGQVAFEALAGEVARRGMGLVVDFVPNHMAADASQNHWWAEVLENGACSPHADYFAIDWHPLKPEIEGRLLLPILGDQYGAVLERGELRLDYDDGRLIVRYFDHVLPVTPRSAPLVLRQDLEALEAGLGADHPDLRELLSILTGLDHLPPFTETDRARIEERSREKEVLRERLARLTARSEPVRRHVERALTIANGTVGESASFDLLHALLERQVYRLAYWRTASHEINYRRFFDINELAGLRVEHEDVFAATHGWLADAVTRGLVTGIRVDHPDGLYDPEQYFERLRGLAPGGWIVAEKILTGDEQLRAAWPVDGTTGYAFLTLLNRLFVHGDGLKELGRIYRRFTGRLMPFEDVAYESKTLIMDTAMSSELNVLADALNRLSELDRRSRDYTLNALRDALAEVVAAFPVYRTYVTDRGWTEEDRRIIELAIRRARVRNPAIEPSVFTFIEGVLLPEALGRAAREPREVWPPAVADRLELSMKLQQYTAPVEAKGLEDTAFYRHIPLLSLNEVGGDPDAAPDGVEHFHRANARRRREWPLDMLATSTHDTKLGEDTRARIDAMSQMPARWRQAVFRWSRTTAGAQLPTETGAAPDRNDQYPVLPGARRMLAVGMERARGGHAGIRRPPHGLHDQGGARGQAPHELGEPARRVPVGDRAIRGAHAHRSREPAVPPSARGHRRRARPRGDDDLARAARVQAGRTRRRRRVPGHGALGADARRPRQSPAGRFRRARRDAGRSRPAAPRRPRAGPPGALRTSCRPGGRPGPDLARWPDQAAGDRGRPPAAAGLSGRPARRRVSGPGRGSRRLRRRARVVCPVGRRAFPDRRCPAASRGRRSSRRRLVGLGPRGAAGHARGPAAPQRAHRRTDRADRARRHRLASGS